LADKVQAQQCALCSLCENGHNCLSAKTYDFTGQGRRSVRHRRSGRNTPPDFVKASPMATMKMSMEELRDYCVRVDAAKGKVNGSAAAPAVAEVVETGPILREPQRPPRG
jgi:hypothetical protein